MTDYVTTLEDRLYALRCRIDRLEQVNQLLQSQIVNLQEKNLELSDELERKDNEPKKHHFDITSATFKMSGF